MANEILEQEPTPLVQSVNVDGVKVHFREHPRKYSVDLEEKAMDLDYGWLGKFFGSPSNAPTNIGGFIAAMSILIILVGCFFQSGNEIAKSVIPIVTAVLGYIFGKHSHTEK